MHYYIHNHHCNKELSCTPDYAAELTTVYTQVVFFTPSIFFLSMGYRIGVSQPHFMDISKITIDGIGRRVIVRR